MYHKIAIDQGAGRKIISRWIERALASDPPRARSLVITVFGDSILPHGGGTWLGSLISLMEPFGINERLVRSSVFRLARDGWFRVERHGRRSRYTFTASARQRFERAHAKIYFHATDAWEGEWTLVLLPPRTTRLRRELEWEGFRALSPGLMAHPQANSVAVEEIMRRTGNTTRSTVFTARGEALNARLQSCWDLADVVAGYQLFIRRYQTLAQVLEGNLTTASAFQIRTLLIHSFRRVLLHDPLLPPELLPPSWPGVRAYELCKLLYLRVWPAAERHLGEVLGGPPADGRVFYDRFGGLL